MQIKFNFSFIFDGLSATAWQRASSVRRRRWRLWLACPIMTLFRYVPYVSSVTFLTFRALRWTETPLKSEVSAKGLSKSLSHKVKSPTSYSVHRLLCHSNAVPRINWSPAQRRRSLSTVGGTHSRQSTPPLLSSSHSPSFFPPLQIPSPETV